MIEYNTNYIYIIIIITITITITITIITIIMKKNFLINKFLFLLKQNSETTER